MTYTLPVSKRGTLTLPPELRRRLKLDQVASPLVIVEERDGGLFLQSAVAMPIRDIPKATIRQWVLNDEADARGLASPDHGSPAGTMDTADLCLLRPRGRA
jgi:bifunctional DNA-binding transcriptional regulator/antitoxin component of YhaV-PrlF toxin-antitoxin module